MRKSVRLFVSLAFVSLLCVQGLSAQSKHVFGGFAFKAALDSSADQKGWNAELGLRDTERLQIVFDASGLYRPTPWGNLNTHTVQVGPQVMLFPGAKIRPFFRGMIGFYHSSWTNGVALSLGGGLDWKVREKMSIRVIQADAFLNDQDYGPNVESVRLASGLVFSF